jgi:CRP/FNR family transcriptional regulator
MHEDVLSKVPIFADLSTKELQLLGATARERQFAAGETMIRQGETASGLFVIVSGKVRVVQQGAGGERELGVYGKDAVLGEMALLDDLPRTATVIASEPTTALIIPAWDFRAALRENPDIALKLLAVLSKRLRKAEGQGAANA